jgi:hypothetical protein
MSNTPDTDKERGDAAKEGFGENEKPNPHQDTPQRPNLAPPAEESKGPGRDDGLGQPDGAEVDPNQPVPPGNPLTESDRPDNQ